MTPFAAHADWSVAPGKRWICLATPDGAGWSVRCERVGAPETLLARLREDSGMRPCVVAFDAPIGLPIAYARTSARAFGDFPAFLRALGPDDPFFRVASTLEEAGPERPFFPRGAWSGPGRTVHAARLGVADPASLLRRCDRATACRPAAAALFWTLGANQVGKGAITLWRDVLAPGLRRGEVALWPFAGSLRALLGSERMVAAEAYPAEALRRLQPGFRGSKRRRTDRAGLAGVLLGALRELGATPSRALSQDIADGFGDAADGEDRFDSVLGLLAVLRVLRDPARDVVPEDAGVRAWEGWILGQDAEPGSSVASLSDRSSA